MRKINFKKVHPKAKNPVKGTEGSAAFDLYCADLAFLPNNIIECNSGIAFEIPENFVGLLFSRSSISKMQLSMTNCVGVIDSDYRGVVKARFYKMSKSFVEFYKVGERFAQIIFVPHPTIILQEKQKLSRTIRGEAGFGSTGK